MPGQPGLTGQLLLSQKFANASALLTRLVASNWWPLRSTMMILVRASPRSKTPFTLEPV